MAEVVQRNLELLLPQLEELERSGIFSTLEIKWAFKYEYSARYLELYATL